jgi:hypothetical protein
VRSFVLLTLLVTMGCKDVFPRGRTCAGVGGNAITVSIRDQAGRAMAFGSTVTFADLNSNYVDSRIETSDSLKIEGIPDHDGRWGFGATYRVIVEKLYYTPTVFENVTTPYVECVTSDISVKLDATLALRADAPPMRGIKVMPIGSYLDRPPRLGVVTHAPWFDADPGASRAVIWSISGDTASVTFDAALGRVSYRCRSTPGRVWVRATSVANPSVTDSTRISVQHHPDGTNDPPCS